MRSASHALLRADSLGTGRFCDDIDLFAEQNSFSGGNTGGEHWLYTMAPAKLPVLWTGSVVIFNSSMNPAIPHILWRECGTGTK
jgi:hypothetical protein